MPRTTRNKGVKDIVEVCHRLYARGFVSATDGNVSILLKNGNTLTTRSGINKGMVTPKDLIEVTARGNRRSGKGRPTTELGMHRYIYKQRPDVRAVVHAHPPYATGFAAARLCLDEFLFPEVIVGLGTIPLAAYATPSTPEVAESLKPFVADFDAILLANHGVVTFGTDVFEAFFKMEKVEHAAHITFVARMLGGAIPLTADELERLRTVSRESYGKEISAGLFGMTTGKHVQTMSDEEVRKYIEQRLEDLKII